MVRSITELHDLLGTLEPPYPGSRHPYVDELELTSADEPALLEIWKLWIDEERLRQLSDSSPAAYAPIHALKALAELRAVAVVPTTLALLDTLDAQGDQWYLEEFPRVCAQIGPAALAPLAAYLGDESHGEFPRIAVAHALREVAQHHPFTRDEVLEALVGVLARHDARVASLTAFVIGYLVDLRATEHEDLIRAAFAARCVDTMVCGDWSEISEELRFGRRPVTREPLFEFGPTPTEPAQPNARGKVKPKQDKTARKRSKAARKRNRK